MAQTDTSTIAWCSRAQVNLSLLSEIIGRVDKVKQSKEVREKNVKKIGTPCTKLKAGFRGWHRIGASHPDGCPKALSNAMRQYEQR